MSLKFELEEDRGGNWISDDQNYCFPIFIINGVVVAASKLGEGSLRVVLRQHGREPVTIKSRLPRGAAGGPLIVELFWHDRNAAMRLEAPPAGAKPAQAGANGADVLVLDDFRPAIRQQIRDIG